MNAQRVLSSAAYVSEFGKEQGTDKKKRNQWINQQIERWCKRWKDSSFRLRDIYNNKWGKLSLSRVWRLLFMLRTTECRKTLAATCQMINSPVYCVSSAALKVSAVKTNVCSRKEQTRRMSRYTGNMQNKKDLMKTDGGFRRFSLLFVTHSVW